MTTHEVFHGSNGEATTALYKKLEAIGPVGFIAMNLFRACKASARAKLYSRKFKSVAYEKKQYSMDLLAAALSKHAEALNIVWGWRIDPNQNFHNWVLYVDLPSIGQVSFHTAARGKGPNYDREFDGSFKSAERIIEWCDHLLLGSGRAYENPERCSDHSRRGSPGQDPHPVGSATPPSGPDHSTDRATDGAGHRSGAGGLQEVRASPPPASPQQQTLV